MKKRYWIYSTLAILIIIGFSLSKKINLNISYEIGQQIDQFNGITVYYNGGVGHVKGRNITADGYNLGLKYQCVEFVKRYYYEHLNHKMPDSYGHAKDFFLPNLNDGAMNEQRALNQYTNPSISKPQDNDIVVFTGSIWNKFGHVAIVSKVVSNHIEIIQQNAGPFGRTRVTYPLEKINNKWVIKHDSIIGWLRKV